MSRLLQGLVVADQKMLEATTTEDHQLWEERRARLAEAYYKFYDPDTPLSMLDYDEIDAAIDLAQGLILGKS